MDRKIDVILVGAGLANCLLAFFLRERRPDARVVLLEVQSEIMRARTWSFHETDIDPGVFPTLSPLVSKSWPGYEVRFPEISREFQSKYFSIRPEDLEAHMRAKFGDDLQFNVKVRSVRADQVELEDGRTLKAPCVIDGRGTNAFTSQNVAYQKFVGLHVRFAYPHGLLRPILMDATVEQRDGYRFIYVLPWSESEALIEDTYYSETSSVDSAHSELAIREYAHAHGWKIESITSRESGSLPLPLFPLLPREHAHPPVPKFGVAGGFFHPVTGYSLPDAVRLSDRVSSLPFLTSESVFSELELYSRERAADWKYFCLLNRLMFEAALPEERFRVLQHFYRLPDALVGHFYRGTLNKLDRVRILSGKPPVPMARALRCLWSSGL